MRIAVIADVHGNQRALAATLQDVSRASPDLTLNLGDCLSGPFDVVATADLLISLGVPTVAGNHDRHLLKSHIADLGPADRFARERLQPRHLEWLQNLTPTYSVDEVFACHGSPTSDTDYLLDEIEGNALILASPSSVAKHIEAANHPRVLLCAHSHQPRVVRSGQTLVVNPGSVGLPAYAATTPAPHVSETGSPHARYAVIDRTRDGWVVSLKAVDYDWDAAAAEAERAEMEIWARALATGYARIG